MTERSFAVLKPGGRVAFIASGSTAPEPPRGDVTSLRPRVGRDRPHLERILELYEAGAVTVPEVTTFPARRRRVRARDKRGTSPAGQAGPANPLTGSIRSNRRALHTHSGYYNTHYEYERFSTCRRAVHVDAATRARPALRAAGPGILCHRDHRVGRLGARSRAARAGPPRRKRPRRGLPRRQPQALPANPESPLFDEICGIVRKTVGLEEAVRDALEPLADRLVLALLFGSVARGTETAASDIDLLLVSDDLTLEAVYAAVAGAEDLLGRRVNPTVYTSRSRGAPPGQSRFLTRTLQRPHIVLIGKLDGE